MKQQVNIAYKRAITTKKRYTFLIGGRGAGRSTFASQLALALLTAVGYFRAAIMRYVLGDIRSSIYQEVTDRADELDITNSIKINDTLMTFEYGHNSINAKGFKKSTSQQKAKLKSLASYNYVFIEEADEIEEADFMQLDDSLRTTKGDIRLIFMLNPPPKTHWIIQRFFDLLPALDEDGVVIPGFYSIKVKPELEDDVELIHTTYKDNRANISDHTAKNYEFYRTTKPLHYWNMIRGLVPETVIGKIYKGWKQIDEIPKEAQYLRNGLDFGYTNDPTAVIAILKWNNAIILDEVTYMRGMNNAQIAGVIKNAENMLTIADSSEPKSIDELEERGVNVLGAQKGPGSVLQGISHVQSLKIFVTKRSKYIWKEYENYAWLIDKETGETKNEVKPNQMDHAMDAIRYGLQFDMPLTTSNEVVVSGGRVQEMYEDVPIAGGLGVEYEDMSIPSTLNDPNGW